MSKITINIEAYTKLSPQERRDLDIEKIIVSEKCYVVQSRIFLSSDAPALKTTFIKLYGVWNDYFSNNAFVLYVDGISLGYYSLKDKFLYLYEKDNGGYSLGAFLAELRKFSATIGAEIDFIMPPYPYIESVRGNYLDPVFSELHKVHTDEGSHFSMHSYGFNFKDFPNIHTVGKAIVNGVLIFCPNPPFFSVKIRACSGRASEIWVAACIRKGIPILNDSYVEYDSVENRIGGWWPRGLDAPIIQAVISKGSPKLVYASSRLILSDLFTSALYSNNFILSYKYGYIENFLGMSLKDGFLTPEILTSLGNTRTQFILGSIYVNGLNMGMNELYHAIIANSEAFLSPKISFLTPVRSADKKTITALVRGMVIAYRDYAQWTTSPQVVPESRRKFADEFILDMPAVLRSARNWASFVTDGLYVPAGEYRGYSEPVMIKMTTSGVTSTRPSMLEPSSSEVERIETPTVLKIAYARLFDGGGAKYIVNKITWDLIGMTYSRVVGYGYTVAEALADKPYPTVEPNYKYIPQGDARVEYSLSAGGDGETTITYVVYDEDNVDITDQFKTLTVGNYFLHKEFE